MRSQHAHTGTQARKQMWHAHARTRCIAPQRHTSTCSLSSPRVCGQSGSHHMQADLASSPPPINRHKTKGPAGAAGVAHRGVRAVSPGASASCTQHKQGAAKRCLVTGTSAMLLLHVCPKHSRACLCGRSPAVKSLQAILSTHWACMHQLMALLCHGEPPRHNMLQGGAFRSSCTPISS